MTSPIFSTVAVFAMGFAGYLAFRLLRTPAPGLIGSIFVLSFLNFHSLLPNYPEPTVSFVSKIIIGVMLGRGVTRDSLIALRDAVLPTVFASSWMIALSIFSGYIFHWTSGVRLDSALLASAAGGISEMAVVALAVGADVGIVLLVQLFRFVTIVMVTPFLAKGFAARYGVTKARAKKAPPADAFRRDDYLLLAACVICGAFAGRWARVPAGDMLGATLATAAVVLSRGRMPLFHPLLRTVAQIGLGAAIARNITHETLEVIGETFLPLVVPTFVLLAGTLLLVFLMVKLFGFDFATALLATSPGGLSQMAIMADELGADGLRIAAMQLVRLLAIIATMPAVVKWLAG